MNSVKQKSILIPICEKQNLHLRHIYQEGCTGSAVLLLHGAIENGKIFYTEKNKGFAPFLAKNGYNCFVADLRGRGLSKPGISAYSDYGQTEAIVEDIPAFIKAIKNSTGKEPEYWVAHSWGGVLMNSFLARHPEMISKVKACAYFGSKRSLYNTHPQKFFKANLLWYFLAPKIVKNKGYLPAKRLGWGSDDETQKSLMHSVAWAKIAPWIDPQDSFDYGHAVAELSLPPILHIAAIKDKALAQTIDIQKFMDESGKGTQKMNLYGKKYGHGHNYDHIDMLTHAKAHNDQFQDVLNWFEQYST
ncbi:esterase [Pseudoalteromonas sp. NBT06-2]|uniref:alpha/beta fold hydrolase n=1 Tax=Pseudoalteromonas sp. NBT06-2 TaxID=2025950 RepID=UPI000BA74368|nr:alpha/beta fold hydrolase [Pseudoalteromonas sp. NBT06-2]PAJ76196.1 esterase [Pseudoalteromonas sp. NBT06-2]